MSDETTLLSCCRALGAEVTPQSDGRLKVQAPPPLPQVWVEGLRQHKTEILALRTPLYINNRNELIIPLGANLKYRYWIGGQSVAEILLELNALPEV